MTEQRELGTNAAMAHERVLVTSAKGDGLYHGNDSLPLGDGKACPHCGAHYDDGTPGFALSWSGLEYGRAWVGFEDDGTLYVNAKSSADDSMLETNPYRCIECSGVIEMPDDMEVDWS